MSDPELSTIDVVVKATDLDQNIVDNNRKLPAASATGKPSKTGLRQSAVIERFLNPEHIPANRPKGHAEGRMERLSCSPKEAAASLGVHENTIWNYLRRGDLDSVRVGGRRLIKVDSVRALAGLSTPAGA